MDNYVWIYRQYVGDPDRMRFFDEGPHQNIIYHFTTGLVIDQKQGSEIVLPVSRWKLAGIGLSCILAAITAKGGPKRQLSPDEENIRGAWKVIGAIAIFFVFLCWLVWQFNL